jgi:hypothetical protein
MNIEEWTTAYVLRFGADRIHMTTYAEGEVEFLEQAGRDLVTVDVEGKPSAAWQIMRELERQGYKRAYR